MLRQLSRRFGELEEATKQKIRLLSVEQLEALGEELLDFSSLEELQGWLKQQ